MQKKRILKSVIWGILVTWLAYIWVTADYSSLTKNTWDTLTAASWNQLIDNVKWIQTDSNLNVGIGTSNPSAKLGVEWFLAWKSALHIYKPTSSTNKYIDLKSDSISSWSYWIHAAGNEASDTFVVRWDGNVWIWTADLNAKLTVRATNKHIATFWSEDWFTLNDVSGYTNLTWFSRYNGTSYISTHATVKPSKIVASDVGISFATSTDTGIGNTVNWSTKLRIQNDWNVWIGTENPQWPLEISASSNPVSIFREDNGWTAGDNNYLHTIGFRDGGTTQTDWASITWMTDSVVWWTWQLRFNIAWHGHVITLRDWFAWIWQNNPTEKLHINWAIKMWTTTSACDSSKHGTVKFEWDDFYGCKSTGWVKLNP